MGDRKGVISLTTPELRAINGDNQLSNLLIKLKDSYYIGLHHNWHPVDFELDNRFDFHFLCQRDVVSAMKRSDLIELDACNFVPQYFNSTNETKVWDLLIVGRNVEFKQPFRTLKCIRNLYSKGEQIRVLYICPMSESETNGTQDSNLRLSYESMFTQNEKTTFTLLNPNTNFPFPFDRYSLAMFYRASRTYAHFAAHETRCRVAAYAFSTEIPVVGTSSIANIIPTGFADRPAFFEVMDDNFEETIIEALSAPKVSLEESVRRFVNEDNSVDILISKLNFMLSPNDLFSRNQILSKNLDIRLGWHHFDNDGANSAGSSLRDFFDFLLTSNHRSIDLRNMQESDYPERDLLSNFKDDELDIISSQNERTEIYLNSRKKEIEGVRRGNFRFYIYRLLANLSKVPIIGSLILKIYMSIKRIITIER